MANQKILKQAKAILNSRRYLAEKLAYDNIQIALENIPFKVNDTNITNLNIKIARLEFEGKDTSTENELLKALQKERKAILYALNMDEDDFVPHYTCKKCNDSGIAGGKYCKCLNLEVNKLLTKDLGLDIDKSHTFKNANKLILAENNLTKTYEKLTAWVDKFPESKYKTLTFIGAAGSGKTYLTECIANALIAKQVVVNFVTAFNLNHIMLKYHTTFDDTKDNILEPFLSCEVLIIDDLGTEPVLKNVTKEYLYLILNERIITGKNTIITTNLSPDGLIDRYEERIFSRLFNKQNSLKLNFTGGDLRLKK